MIWFGFWQPSGQRVLQLVWCDMDNEHFDHTCVHWPTIRAGRSMSHAAGRVGTMPQAQLVFKVLQPGEHADLRKQAFSLHKLAKVNGRPAFSPAQLKVLQAQLEEYVCVVGQVVSEGQTELVAACLGATCSTSLNLLSVAVRADWRAKGIGKQVLACLDEHARSIPRCQEVVCWHEPEHRSITKLLHAAGFSLGAYPSHGSKPPAYLGTSCQAAVLQLGTKAQLIHNSVDTAQQEPVVQEQPQDLHIMCMDTSHLDEVVQLHQAAMYNGKPVFGKGERFASVKEMLSIMATSPTPDMTAYVAVGPPATPGSPSTVQGVITGQVSDAPDAPGGLQMVLLTVAVTPGARKAGLGTALLDELIMHTKQAGVSQIVTDVATLNKPALEFFIDQGFVIPHKVVSPVAIKSGFGQAAAVTPEKKPARMVEMILQLQPVVPASPAAALPASRSAAACASWPTRDQAAAVLGPRCVLKAHVRRPQLRTPRVARLLDRARVTTWPASRVGGARVCLV